MMKKTIILAAGKGSRMGSDLPKAVHQVGGKEMINHVVDVAENAGVEENIVILGYKADEVKSAINSSKVKFGYQKEQLGTGHAAKAGLEFVNDNDDVLILFGDMPLLSTETVKGVYDVMKDTNADMVECTTFLDNPFGCGRICRDKEGRIERIVEQKMIQTEEVENIKEVNTGVMCFKGSVLKECLDMLENKNVDNEFYIVDCLEICNKLGKKVSEYVIKDSREGMGANTPEQLANLEKVYKELKIERGNN